MELWHVQENYLLIKVVDVSALRRLVLLLHELILEIDSILFQQLRVLDVARNVELEVIVARGSR